VRRAAIGASAVLALSVALLPWFALDSYEPNGWDATWWARAALAAALMNIVLLRVSRDHAAVAAAALALAFTAVRVAAPPDFGFGFDGLKVPVERQAGCWVALAASLLALLASARLARSRSEPAAPPPPEASSAAAPP
jgi:ABC-type branched-subunit amino acid transport system permease subunit